MSDLLGNVESTLATEFCKQAFHSVQEVVTRWNVTVSSSEDGINAAIAAHQLEIKHWSEEISFKDLLRAKQTEDVFVPLDIYLLPRRQRFSNSERIPSAPLSSVLEGESVAHLVILGQPGAGKTTAVKHLCQQMLADGKVCPSQNFPLLIRLGDLNNANTITHDLDDLIIERLQAILNIPLSFPPDLEAKDALATKKSLIEQAVVTVLENLRPLILLDGLDEVSHKLRRDSIVKGIRRLAMQLENARMILTARTGEFTYHIEKMTAYEIAPLSKQQISMFAIGWLGAGEATGFLSQVEHSPFADTAIKPLTLAHLCAIFERVHRIPEKPKSVYKKIVSLLLEDWDQQRSVQRVSSYLNYAQILAQLR